MAQVFGLPCRCCKRPVAESAVLVSRALDSLVKPFRELCEETWHEIFGHAKRQLFEAIEELIQIDIKFTFDVLRHVPGCSVVG